MNQRLPGPDLAAIAAAASREAGGVPVGLLGDYLPAAAEAAASGRRLTAAELSGYGRSGEQAALSGVALRGLVDLFLSATWRLWRELPAGTSPAAVRAAGLAVLRAADDAVAAAAEGFERALLTVARREEAERREFFDDLLSGRGGVGDLIVRGDQLGLRLAGPHQVVVAGSAAAGAALNPAGVDGRRGGRRRGGAIAGAGRDPGRPDRGHHRGGRREGGGPGGAGPGAAAGAGAAGTRARRRAGGNGPGAGAGGNGSGGTAGGPGAVTAVADRGGAALSRAERRGALVRGSGGGARRRRTARPAGTGGQRRGPARLPGPAARPDGHHRPGAHRAHAAGNRPRRGGTAAGHPGCLLRPWRRRRRGSEGPASVGSRGHLSPGPGQGPDRT